MELSHIEAPELVLETLQSSHYFEQHPSAAVFDSDFRLWSAMDPLVDVGEQLSSQMRSHLAGGEVEHLPLVCESADPAGQNFV